MRSFSVRLSLPCHRLTTIDDVSGCFGAMWRQQNATPPRPLARCSAAWQRTFWAALCQPVVGGEADPRGRVSSLVSSCAAAPSRQSARFAKAARRLGDAVPSKMT